MHKATDDFSNDKIANMTGYDFESMLRNDIRSAAYFKVDYVFSQPEFNTIVYKVIYDSEVDNVQWK